VLSHLSSYFLGVEIGITFTAFFFAEDFQMNLLVTFLFRFVQGSAFCRQVSLRDILTRSDEDWMRTSFQACIFLETVSPYYLSPRSFISDNRFHPFRRKNMEGRILGVATPYSLIFDISYLMLSQNLTKDIPIRTKAQKESVRNLRYSCARARGREASS